MSCIINGIRSLPCFRTYYGYSEVNNPHKKIAEWIKNNPIEAFLPLSSSLDVENAAKILIKSLPVKSVTNDTKSDVSAHIIQIAQTSDKVRKEMRRQLKKVTFTKAVYPEYKSNLDSTLIWTFSR